MLRFEHNVGADGGITFTELWGVRSRNHNFRGRKMAKVSKYELVYFSKIRKGLWLLNTISTTFLLVMFIYRDLDTVFLSFFCIRGYLYF